MTKKIMFNEKYSLTQAVLNGRKTMTRRVLKIPKTCNNTEVYDFCVLTNSLGTQCVDLLDENENIAGSWAPKYKVGEVVAIAQSYEVVYAEMIADFIRHNYHFPREDAAEKFKKIYENCAGWKNKMFVKADLMPHHIRITDIKVERLQDISDDDIMREGVWQLHHDNELFYVSKNIGYAPTVAFPSARLAFWYLIDKISGNGTWESNPWVVAYSFELVD